MSSANAVQPRWSIERTSPGKAPTNPAKETLNEERTEVEILIDQFCRRALGGLIPIGRISDLWQAMEVLKKWDDFKTSH